MKKQYLLLTALLLALLLAFSGCVAPGTSAVATTPPATSPAAPETAPAPRSLTTLPELETTLEQIYAHVNPSVVNIRVVQKQEVTSSTPQAPQEFYSQGQGSGFIWDGKGDIVTNNHVVAGADLIYVTFYDGTTVQGSVIGADPDSDLAVVEVDMPANQLQPVQIADSTQVKVGQLAVAIGNPFGLQGTMTVGFVSALGRLLPADTQAVAGTSYSIPDIIQTDASINPGNSGGVLVDRDGNVIGVTSAIVSSIGISAGIGFAIPTVIVQKVVPSLIKTGHYDHPWLGISALSMTPDLAKAMGLAAQQRGVLIVEVFSGSPSEKAGLRGSDRQVTINGALAGVGGDVITGVDGRAIRAFDDLVTYLARSTEIGQTVTLTVLSQGKEKVVKVTLAARPKSAT